MEHVKLFADIAAELTATDGSPWRVDDETVGADTALVLNDNGRELALRLDGKRLTVRGHFPFRHLPGGGFAAPDLPYGAVVPGITVSASKPAATIVRHIRRRLMGPYEALREVVIERHNAANAHEQATADAYARLAAETGATVGDNGRKYLHWSNRGTDNGYIFGAQVDGAKVALDLRSLPVDVAIQIVNLVHDRKAEPKWDAK